MADSLIGPLDRVDAFLGSGNENGLEEHFGRKLNTAGRVGNTFRGVF